MAEEKKEDPAKDAAAAPPKKSNKKLFLIIGGVVGLLVLIGAPVAFFALTKEKKTDSVLAADAATAGEEHTEEALVPEGKDDEEELEEGEEAIGALFPLDSFVVNLTGGSYLRVQVQLEFTDRDIPQRFYMRLVPIRDAILSLLATHTAAGLAEPKDREILKKDIREISNSILRKEQIRRVYFTQFVIQ